MQDGCTFTCTESTESVQPSCTEAHELALSCGPSGHYRAVLGLRPARVPTRRLASRPSDVPWDACGAFFWCLGADGKDSHDSAPQGPRTRVLTLYGTGFIQNSIAHYLALLQTNLN